MQVFTKYLNLICMVLVIYLIYAISINYSLSWAQELSVVSTRGHYDLSSGNALSSQPYNPLTTEFLDNMCTNDEVVVYVHGVWTNERGHITTSAENAEEIFNRLRMSLDSVGYDSPLIGFSWDSDTETDLEGTGWNIAKYIANENGPKLAQFILDLKEHCIEVSSNDIQVRLLGHSLGSRVILSALQSLDNNNEWTSNGFDISAVNLLGGAVDNYEVLQSMDDSLNESEIKRYYGDAINNQVQNFYNMYNPEDDVLEKKYYWTSEWAEPIYYPFYEGGNFAIGQNPLDESTPGMPDNYENVNVEENLIVKIDADNDGLTLGGSGCDLPNYLPWRTSPCTIHGLGDNHLGYIGFRDSDDSLLNDGAIDEVLVTWNLP